MISEKVSARDIQIALTSKYTQLILYEQKNENNKTCTQKKIYHIKLCLQEFTKYQDYFCTEIKCKVYTHNIVNSDTISNTVDVL